MEIHDQERHLAEAEITTLSAETNVSGRERGLKSGRVDALRTGPVS